MEGKAPKGNLQNAACILCVNIKIRDITDKCFTLDPTSFNRKASLMGNAELEGSVTGDWILRNHLQDSTYI